MPNPNIRTNTRLATQQQRQQKTIRGDRLGLRQLPSDAPPDRSTIPLLLFISKNLLHHEPRLPKSWGFQISHLAAVLASREAEEEGAGGKTCRWVTAAAEKRGRSGGGDADPEDGLLNWRTTESVVGIYRRAT